MAERPNYERLVEWFTSNMSMGTRRKLMAEMPMEYHLLYPDVDPGVIAEVVRQTLAETTPKPVYVMRDMHTREP